MLHLGSCHGEALPFSAGLSSGGSVFPAPTPQEPWHRTQLITNGFSTPEEWGLPGPRTISAVVWHDMEGYLAGAIPHWNSGAAGAHLCILRDGTIVRTCRLEDIAWHAGTDNTPGSTVYGRTPFWRTHNINPVSIGIELEGFVASGYTAQQISSCVLLGRWLRNVYGIAPVRGRESDPPMGHYLHGEISAMRSDPGPLFPFDAILRAIGE